MATIDTSKLDALFRSYGFEKYDPGDPNLLVFLRREGYFHNAEIVPLTETSSVDNVARDLQRSGYATKITRFKSLQEVEQKLFSGFFQVESTTKRLIRECTDFKSKIARSLGSEYQYVSAPYSKDGFEQAKQGGIVSDIMECMSLDGPVLVFLEASAGFGKTCTSFEILESYTSRSSGSIAKNPILAELRRNRQARIFKYVLYDELYRNYGSCGLTPDMVEREIKTGRIPLIIDGFDELLHLDRESDVTGQSGDVEPMLRTLSSILESQTKILVTTRRTAIFGEVFDEWLSGLTNGGVVKAFRFTLKDPRIEDWIGSRKKKILDEIGLPIKDLANPVLLAFIRAQSDEEFAAMAKGHESFVLKYFHSLLDRERVRQELPLSVEQQMSILTTVAQQLMDGRTSSISRDELKKCIVEGHHLALTDALRSSPDISATTPEELADKLTDHALLDRRVDQIDGIGFVNDFVYGTMAGLAMLNGPPSAWFEEGDLDKAVTAFQFRPSNDRTLLWQRLEEEVGALDESWQVRFDLSLQGNLSRDLDGCVVQDITFSDCTIGSDYDAVNVTFVRCTFTRSKFHSPRLENVGFVSCIFSGCSVSSSETPTPGACWFDRDCREFEGSVTSSWVHVEEDVVSDARDYEKVVLEQFWPTGRPNARKVLRIATLYSGIDLREKRALSMAIDRLRADGLIQFEDHLAVMDFGRMMDIRLRLGRS